MVLRVDEALLGRGVLSPPQHIADLRIFLVKVSACGGCRADEICLLLWGCGSRTVSAARRSSSSSLIPR